MMQSGPVKKFRHEKLPWNNNFENTFSTLLASSRDLPNLREILKIKIDELEEKKILQYLFDIYPNLKSLAPSAIPRHLFTDTFLKKKQSNTNDPADSHLKNDLLKQQNHNTKFMILSSTDVEIGSEDYLQAKPLQDGTVISFNDHSADLFPCIDSIDHVKTHMKNFAKLNLNIQDESDSSLVERKYIVLKTNNFFNSSGSLSKKCSTDASASSQQCEQGEVVQFVKENDTYPLFKINSKNYYDQLFNKAINKIIAQNIVQFPNDSNLESPNNNQKNQEYDQTNYSSEQNFFEDLYLSNRHYSENEGDARYYKDKYAKGKSTFATNSIFNQLQFKPVYDETPSNDELKVTYLDNKVFNPDFSFAKKIKIDKFEKNFVTKFNIKQPFQPDVHKVIVNEIEKNVNSTNDKIEYLKTSENFDILHNNSFFKYAKPLKADAQESSHTSSPITTPSKASSNKGESIGSSSPVKRESISGDQNVNIKDFLRDNQKSEKNIKSQIHKEHANDAHLQLQKDGLLSKETSNPYSEMDVKVYPIELHYKKFMVKQINGQLKTDEKVNDDGKQTPTREVKYLRKIDNTKPSISVESDGKSSKESGLTKTYSSDQSAFDPIMKILKYRDDRRYQTKNPKLDASFKTKKNNDDKAQLSRSRNVEKSKKVTTNRGEQQTGKYLDNVLITPYLNAYIDSPPPQLKPKDLPLILQKSKPSTSTPTKKTKKYRKRRKIKSKKESNSSNSSLSLERSVERCVPIRSSEIESIQNVTYKENDGKFHNLDKKEWEKRVLNKLEFFLNQSTDGKSVNEFTTKLNAKKKIQNIIDQKKISDERRQEKRHSKKRAKKNRSDLKTDHDYDGDNEHDSKVQGSSRIKIQKQEEQNNEITNTSSIIESSFNIPKTNIIKLRTNAANSPLKIKDNIYLSKNDMGKMEYYNDDRKKERNYIISRTMDELISAKSSEDDSLNHYHKNRHQQVHNWQHTHSLQEENGSKNRMKHRDTYKSTEKGNEVTDRNRSKHSKKGKEYDSPNNNSSVYGFPKRRIREETNKILEIKTKGHESLDKERSNRSRETAMKNRDDNEVRNKRKHNHHRSKSLGRNSTKGLKDEFETTKMNKQRNDKSKMQEKIESKEKKSSFLLKEESWLGVSNEKEERKVYKSLRTEKEVKKGIDGNKNLPNNGLANEEECIDEKNQRSMRSSGTKLKKDKLIDTENEVKPKKNASKNEKEKCRHKCLQIDSDESTHEVIAKIYNLLSQMENNKGSCCSHCRNKIDELSNFEQRKPKTPTGGTDASLHLNLNKEFDNKMMDKRDDLTRITDKIDSIKKKSIFDKQDKDIRQTKEIQTDENVYCEVRECKDKRSSKMDSSKSKTLDDAQIKNDKKQEEDLYKENNKSKNVKDDMVNKDENKGQSKFVYRAKQFSAKDFVPNREKDDKVKVSKDAKDIEKSKGPLENNKNIIPHFDRKDLKIGEEKILTNRCFRNKCMMNMIKPNKIKEEKEVAKTKTSEKCGTCTKSFKDINKSQFGVPRKLSKEKHVPINGTYEKKTQLKPNDQEIRKNKPNFIKTSSVPELEELYSSDSGTYVIRKKDISKDKDNLPKKIKITLKKPVKDDIIFDREYYPQKRKSSGKHIERNDVIDEISSDDINYINSKHINESSYQLHTKAKCYLPPSDEEKQRPKRYILEEISSLNESSMRMSKIIDSTSGVSSIFSS